MPNRPMKWLELDKEAFTRYVNNLSVLKSISEVKGYTNINLILMKAIEMELRGLTKEEEEELHKKARNAAQRRLVARSVKLKRSWNPLHLKFHLRRFINGTPFATFKKGRKSIG